MGVPNGGMGIEISENKGVREKFGAKDARSRMEKRGTLLELILTEII